MGRKRVLNRRAGRRVRSRTAAAAAATPPEPPSEEPSELPAGRALFREYYARQKLLSSAADWQAFGQSMRSPLPITFRRCGLPSRSAASEACWAEGQQLIRAFEESSGRQGRALPWCHGYQLPLSRLELRSEAQASGAAAALQAWLLRASGCGLVMRQEVVSMVPALLLGVQASHRVLDVCAAPGSKTTQLLEMVSHGAEGGVVVANDAEPLRAYVLAHRLRSLGAGLNAVVVTHRGQTLPRAGEEYDRVLCDVPCSGDGTLRKEPALWASWRPGLSLRLHSLQLQIALRAAALVRAGGSDVSDCMGALVRVGGLLCYSTCSLSPLEDEAVVASLLRAARGALELVDASGQLPELPRAPGLRKWQVIDDAMRRVPSLASLSSEPLTVRRRFRAGMFPPKGGDGAPPLERCMRFLPHLADTGAFFVALLRKTAPLPLGRRGQRHGQEALPLSKQRAAAQLAAGHSLRPLPTEAPAAEARAAEARAAEAPVGREGERLFTRSPSGRRALHVPPRVARFLGFAAEGTADGASSPLCVVHAGCPPGELEEDAEALAARLGAKKSRAERRDASATQRDRKRAQWCH